MVSKSFIQCIYLQEGTRRQSGVFSIRGDKNGESRDFLFLVILILPKYGDLEILSLHDKKKEVFREYVCQ